MDCVLQHIYEMGTLQRGLFRLAAFDSLSRGTAWREVAIRPSWIRSAMPRILGSRGIRRWPINAGDAAAHGTDIAAELTAVMYRVLESEGDEIDSR